MKHHGKEIRTKHEDEEVVELSNYTTEKLLSFPTKVNNNNHKNNNKKKTQHLECNCWVCKILDSSSSLVTNKTETTTTIAAQYEPYNIVSETGDSIFYDPLISSIFNNEEVVDKPRNGQIYIAEDKIQTIVQDELMKYLKGVTLNKNEY